MVSEFSFYNSYITGFMTESKFCKLRNHLSVRGHIIINTALGLASRIFRKFCHEAVEFLSLVQQTLNAIDQMFGRAVIPGPVHLSGLLIALHGCYQNMTNLHGIGPLFFVEDLRQNINAFICFRTHIKIRTINLSNRRTQKRILLGTLNRVSADISVKERKISSIYLCEL